MVVVVTVKASLTLKHIKTTSSLFFDFETTLLIVLTFCLLICFANNMNLGFFSHKSIM